MIKDLSFAQQSALFAKLSNYSYSKPLEAKRLFSKLSFSSTYYKNTGSNIFVVENDTDIVVVCRGTEAKEWNDIKADLSFDLSPSRAGVGKVHQGFRTYTDKLFEPIKNHVLDNPHKCLWLTGHSLGAAMATLFASRLSRSPYDCKVEALFTYGSPKVGNRSFINNFNERITHHRWVHDGDIVTKVPVYPYYHSGKMHFIKNNGDVVPDYDRKLSVFRLLTLLSPYGIWKLLFNDIQDHSSVLYVKHLDFWAETTG